MNNINIAVCHIVRKKKLYLIFCRVWTGRVAGSGQAWINKYGTKIASRWQQVLSERAVR